MRIAEPIKISYKNLMAAKFRSFLTVLGVVIGIASVIIVMAIGASAQKLLLDQVSSSGSNLIGVLPGASNEDGPPASVLGVVTTTLKYSDLQALLKKKNVPNVVSAAGYVSGIATVKSKTESLESSFQGVSASLVEVEDLEMDAGRFFYSEEDTNLSRVAVLGHEVARDLFPNEDPLGKKITIKNISFVIVGVVAKRGSVAFSNPDTLVYVPLFTAQKVLLGIDYLNFIRAKVDANENVEKAVTDVRLTIRIEHGITDPSNDDFSVRNTAQALSVLTNITNVLRYFLVAIAAISLVVGGVGIMNIMLISVNQRIREVGLRKAVGAKERDITSQFLVESVFITLSGGFFGILIGIFVAYLAAVIIQFLGYAWQFLITGQSIILAISVSVLIGLIFGSYPARKASRISPMEALRYE